MTDLRKFNGNAVARNAWSERENLIMRRSFTDPKVSRAQLEALLPKRKWHSIQHQAGKLGLSRRRTTKSSTNPVIRRLWELREREGITRVQLAAKMGYHPIMLGKWERGEATPTLQRIRDWCQALGADLKVIYHGSPLEPTTPEDDDFDLPMLPAPEQAKSL
jgi:ribosome-binding protein aMBF1 (putative translation factor)